MAIRQVILMVRHVRTITNFVISGWFFCLVTHPQLSLEIRIISEDQLTLFPCPTMRMLKSKYFIQFSVSYCTQENKNQRAPNWNKNLCPSHEYFWCITTEMQETCDSKSISVIFFLTDLVLCLECSKGGSDPISQTKNFWKIKVSWVPQTVFQMLPIWMENLHISPYLPFL